MQEPVRQRLNSWKEIAAYVQRDVRTLARWEKDRGLPVHRVPGRRGQIFAFTDEIDEWLTSAIVEDEPTAAPPAPPPRPRRLWRRLAAAGAVAASVLLVAMVTPRLIAPPEPIVAIDTDHHELVARTRQGEAWRYAFDGPIHLLAGNLDRSALADLDGNGTTEVLAVIGHPSSGPEREVLYCFSSAGKLLWQRRIDASLTFGAGRFDSPWNTGPLHVSKAGDRWQLFWVTHHHTWWPSIVTRLDPSGAITGRFIHPGWITAARGLPDGRLVIAGVSNQHGADVIALLDDQSWDGAGPLFEGPYECKDCPPGRPVRYFILPRSELSRLSGSERQTPQIHVFDRTIEVHIVQAPQTSTAIVYEFSRDLELQRVRPSDAYWAWHRQMEQAGVLAHSGRDCPEHASATARRWERHGAWTDVRVPGDASVGPE